MPGFVKNALQLFEFQHAPASTTQYSPSPWTHPTYGTKFQMTNNSNTLAPLPPTGIKFLQRVIENFLYHGHAVVSITLLYLGYLPEAQ